MGEAIRVCDGCGRRVPDGDFSCSGCGRFYAGSFSGAPAGGGTLPRDRSAAVPPPPEGPHPPEGWAPGTGPGATPAPPPLGWVAQPSPSAGFPVPPPPPPPGAVPPTAWVLPTSPTAGTNRGALIVLALVVGIIGLVVVSFVAVALLGTKAKPEFRSIPMGEPIGPLGAGEVTEQAVTTVANPDGAHLDDPMRVIEGACRDAGSFDDPITAWTAFNGLRPGGEGQYVQVVRMGEYGPQWVASIDLATGAVEDATDPDLLIQMGRHTTAVACVMPATSVPDGQGIRCTYQVADNLGVVRETHPVQYPIRRPIYVYELASGELLGSGAADSTPTVCPADTEDPTRAFNLDLTDLELAVWTSDHVKGGEFR